MDFPLRKKQHQKLGGMTTKTISLHKLGIHKIFVSIIIVNKSSHEKLIASNCCCDANYKVVTKVEEIADIFRPLVKQIMS